MAYRLSDAIYDMKQAQVHTIKDRTMKDGDLLERPLLDLVGEGIITTLADLIEKMEERRQYLRDKATEFDNM